MTPRERVTLWLAIGAFAFFAFGRCVDLQSGRDDAAVTIAQENAARIAKAYKASRDSIPVLQAAKFAADGKLAKVRTTARATLTATDSAVASVRADTTQPVAARLVVALASYDSLASAFRAYLAADTSAHAASDRLLRQMSDALVLADSTINAERAVSRALRARECRIVGLPCPTRRTAFVAGAVVATFLFVQVRR